MNICLEIRGYISSEIKLNVTQKNWWRWFIWQKLKAFPSPKLELNIKLSSATKSACGRNFLLLYLTDIPWVPLCPYTHGWKWSYFNTFSGCQVWYIVKELVGKQRRPKKLYFRKAFQVFLMQLAFYTYFEQPELDYKCLEYENDVLFIFFLCEEVFNHILRKWVNQWNNEWMNGFSIMFRCRRLIFLIEKSFFDLVTSLWCLHFPLYLDLYMAHEMNSHFLLSVHQIQL